MWPTRGENPALSVMSKQQSKTSRTGSRAIQLAGSAVEGSLGFALILFVLSSFPAMAAWSLRGDFPHPIIVSFAPNSITINPQKLLEAVTNHLNAHTAALRGGGESSELGGNFLKRYNFDNS